MRKFLNWILSRDAISQTGVTSSIGLLILRVWVGLILAFQHGLGKLTSFTQRSENFADPLGVGSSISLGLVVFAEFFCSLALVLGLFTRAAVIPLIITMLVAAFVIHGDDPFGRKELALMFLGPFIAFLFTGPGRFSLDRLFTQK